MSFRYLLRGNVLLIIFNLYFILNAYIRDNYCDDTLWVDTKGLCIKYHIDSSIFIYFYIFTIYVTLTNTWFKYRNILLGYLGAYFYSLYFNYIMYTIYISEIPYPIALGMLIYKIVIARSSRRVSFKKQDKQD